jgi:hypothetical protein
MEVKTCFSDAGIKWDLGGDGMVGREEGFKRGTKRRG